MAWPSHGLSPEQMERRVVAIGGRSLSTTVSGIERSGSPTFQGIGLMKVRFQPGTAFGAAFAQIPPASGTARRILPPA